MLKVHRSTHTFVPELAAYERLAKHRVTRLQGFDVPQLLDYDSALHILELSFVSPPYILDFVCTGIGTSPAEFDLERIEADASRQFGTDWPEVRRLLEALMQIGLFYGDVHNRNIRLS